jgi:hypothetical protein
VGDDETNRRHDRKAFHRFHLSLEHIVDHCNWDFLGGQKGFGVHDGIRRLGHKPAYHHTEAVTADDSWHNDKQFNAEKYSRRGV